ASKSDTVKGEAFKKCTDSKKEIVKSCESVAYVLNAYGRDWSDSDQFAVVNGKASSNSPAKVSGTTNGKSATTTVGAPSSIQCSSMGIETVDYEPCKKFQVQLDLIEGVQQVGYQAQTLVYSDKMMDSQQKYANEKNSATGALKATGESLKMQQDMMNQRTAIEATKLAYAYTLYTEMPRTSEVSEKCSGIIGQTIKMDLNGVTGLKENTQIKESDCKPAVGTQKGFALLMNQLSLEAMRSKLIGIATTTGSNMLLASLLGKRADDVNNAIAKIDAFKPADPYTTTEAEAQSTFCKQNPGLAQCLTAGLERTFDTMNDNVITFGDGATGTQYGGGVNADGTTATGAINDPTARAPVTPVGSIIAAAAQDNKMEKSDAAKVSTSGTGASGGGGGGSGGGASGGGGGGAPPAVGSAGGAAAAVQGKTPTYGGGSGSFSVMGGFGINKRKGDGKDEGNPFGKLFGKDGKADSTLNFRDIASQKVGSKGDNLFDMISKRYTSVNADKRLLEYELAK
ncbi:MAG: hypothetical protein H7336_04870, partial [Bacteriovorax sp.]|nr:hypothetical protein [Bacteriovorax sp.]